MTNTLPFADLEDVYDLLAQTIDEVGEARESLFLCKLCLQLAHHIDDVSLIETAIATARENQGTSD